MAELPNEVIISGAVSPTARATPRITEVIRPARAVGSTTDQVVRHSVEPRASEASRRPPGTNRRTSSEVRVMDGSISTDIASAMVELDDPDRKNKETSNNGWNAGHRINEESDRLAQWATNLVEEHCRHDSQWNTDQAGNRNLL